MKNQSKKAGGLAFTRHFTREGVSPYDQFEYDLRTSVIRNPGGDVVFEMNNVEVPKAWSQIATDILAQKYFRKAGVPQADGSTGRETSVKQVVHRVASQVEVPVIVGGGIRDAEKAYLNCKAGADIIVVGNAIEKDISLISEIADAVHGAPVKSGR